MIYLWDRIPAKAIHRTSEDDNIQRCWCVCVTLSLFINVYVCLQGFYVHLWVVLATLVSVCVCACVIKLSCGLISPSVYVFLMNLASPVAEPKACSSLIRPCVVGGHYTEQKMERSNRDRRQERQENNNTNKNNLIYMSPSKTTVTEPYTTVCSSTTMETTITTSTKEVMFLLRFVLFDC